MKETSKNSDTCFDVQFHWLAFCAAAGHSVGYIASGAIGPFSFQGEAGL